MRKSGRKDEELYAEEKHETLDLGTLVGAEDREVPTSPNDDGNPDLVGYLNNHVCEEEGDPGVCFRWTFADFIERALRHEAWHDLETRLAQLQDRRRSRRKDSSPVGPG